MISLLTLQSLWSESIKIEIPQQVFHYHPTIMNFNFRTPVARTIFVGNSEKLLFLASLHLLVGNYSVELDKANIESIDLTFTFQSWIFRNSLKKYMHFKYSIQYSLTVHIHTVLNKNTNFWTTEILLMIK